MTSDGSFLTLPICPVVYIEPRSVRSGPAPRPCARSSSPSGDGDPNDGRTERFDTLFGARRFEFGPTGIYGLLARSNVNSPGVKLDLRPKPGLALMLAYRAA